MSYSNFRLEGLDVADTRVLLDSSGLGPRQRDLLPLMEMTYQRRMRPHLPRHPVGVSIATAPGCGVVAVSVFAYATDVFDDGAPPRVLGGGGPGRQSGDRLEATPTGHPPACVP